MKIYTTIAFALLCVNVFAQNTYPWSSSGNVGIGTNAPGRTLDVAGHYSSAQLRLQRTGNGLGITDIGTDDQGLQFWIGGYDALPEFKIDPSGRVGIGTTNLDAKLTVKGDIHTREVRVDLNGAIVPDYVFEKDYDLLPLSELEAYINTNKHLPEVPSAKEMEANGVNLKEMNMLLLKKIEELTLHVIEADKKAADQQKQIEELQRIVKEK